MSDEHTKDFPRKPGHHKMYLLQYEYKPRDYYRRLYPNKPGMDTLVMREGMSRLQATLLLENGQCGGWKLLTVYSKSNPADAQQ